MVSGGLGRRAATLLLGVSLPLLAAVAPVQATEGATAFPAPGIMINEIGRTAEGGVGWVELYNFGVSEVSLDGLCLTDDPAYPCRWRLSAHLVVPARGYLLLWLDARPGEGPAHAPFDIAAAAGFLGLFTGEEYLYAMLDGVFFPGLSPGSAVGRSPRGNYPWCVVACGTPGAANRYAGDLDCDGRVDAADLGRLMSAWQQSGASADLDGDGFSDETDLDLFRADFMAAGALPPAGADIVFFEAVPGEIAAGQYTRLNWETRSAGEIELAGVGAVPAAGSLLVAPPETREFTLVVRDAETEVADTLTVSVLYSPDILYFLADPSQLRKGETTRLSWAAPAADTVILDGFGEVQSTGSLTLAPQETTTYRLLASAGEDEASAIVTVAVSAPNRPPVAYAGLDQFASQTGTFFLNGSGSFDPDGDPLTFEWQQVFGPPVVLASPFEAVTSFETTTGGTYIFYLVVTDGHGGTDADDVRVVIW
jgi:hypothetical protein